MSGERARPAAPLGRPQAGKLKSLLRRLLARSARRRRTLSAFAPIGELLPGKCLSRSRLVRSPCFGSCLQSGRLLELVQLVRLDWCSRRPAARGLAPGPFGCHCRKALWRQSIRVSYTGLLGCSLQQPARAVVSKPYVYLHVPFIESSRLCCVAGCLWLP